MRALFLFIGDDTTCKQTEIIGDGVCHDSVNILECNFDGGDCCMFKKNTDYCNDCICYELYNLTGNLKMIWMFCWESMEFDQIDTIRRYLDQKIIFKNLAKLSSIEFMTFQVVYSN